MLARMAATVPFIQIMPTCRYGHGELFRVRLGNTLDGFALGGAQGQTPRFDLATFTLHLYICPHCGYSEFFDPDPSSTISAMETYVEDRGSA